MPNSENGGVLLEANQEFKMERAVLAVEVLNASKPKVKFFFALASFHIAFMTDAAGVRTMSLVAEGRKPAQALRRHV